MVGLPKRHLEGSEDIETEVITGVVVVVVEVVVDAAGGRPNRLGFDVATVVAAKVVDAESADFALDNSSVAGVGREVSPNNPPVEGLDTMEVTTTAREEISKQRGILEAYCKETNDYLAENQP